MRKTTAGKVVLALVNVAFLIIAATAVVSAIPPQYNVQLNALPSSSTSTTLTIPMRFNVTNNGFYNINNFYVILTASDPSGNSLGSNQTPAVTIARGGTYTYTVELVLNYTRIHANPGAYLFELEIHSEFAYGLIKFTIIAPMTQTLS